MGNVMAYSGLVTKVRAMQAKLLTDQDFENIAALHSVPEAVEYLKGKPAYADALNRMDDTLYHRHFVRYLPQRERFLQEKDIRDICTVNWQHFMSVPES